MNISRAEFVEKCLNLLDKGYVRCKGDRGYKQGESIQEYFENLSASTISKTEVRMWFKQFKELRNYRKKKPAVINFTDVAEKIVSEDQPNNA